MLVGTMFFQGKCEEAIAAYKKAFDAETTRIVRYRENEHKKGIADAEIYIHGLKFWLTDEPGGPRSQVVVFKELDEVMQAFNLLKQGGEVTHEPNKTPFSVCETAVYDKFHVHWGLMVKSFLEKEKEDAESVRIMKKQTKGGHTFLITTLLLNGQCREALELYQKAFNADVEQLVPIPAERKKDGIEHAEVFIKDHRFWFSDEGGEQSHGMVAVFDSLAQCNKAWDALKDGAKITHAPAATKWSACEASMVDRFGILWGFIVWDERTFLPAIEKKHPLKYEA
jgi:PhnB protein